MKINKSDFSGTGSVFKFTFFRFFKTKANIISMVLLFVFALASVPVMGLTMGALAPSSEPEQEEIMISPVDNIYIINETGMDIPEDSFFGDYWAETSVTVYEKENTLPFVLLSPFDALVKFNEGPGGISIDVSASEETELSSQDLLSVSAEMENLYYSALPSLLGITEEPLAVMNYGYGVNVIEQEDFYSSDIEFSEAGFMVQYAYSIVVLILCTYSATYIVRAVLEEKASKLVELLMVSVKPLALIMGKIFAVMAFMFIQMTGLLICSGISWFISGFFFDTSVIEETLINIDLAFLAGGIGFGDAALILISLALAYLTVSIVSGISGAACNSMEEADSAATAAMLLTLGGYLVSCIAGAIPIRAVAVISSLVPVISVFCAPVQYLSGNIGLGVMILSLIIQLAVVVLLFAFCAKVYSALIIHSGSKLKMKDIFAIAKTSGKEAKENV